MIAASLLATKCRPPAPPPDAVPRPRAAGLLAAGLRGRLILVSAPAGFGKTTVVAAWLAALAAAPATAAEPPPRAAWLALDAEDDAPPRFWSYVVAALQTAAPGVGLVAQAALASPQPPPIEPALVALLNDLAALDGRLLLALDDYHRITAPAIHRGVELLLDHLPPQVCLLIATREDPPLALARLRARGQLAEVRAADLRFSPAEADAFLNAAQGLALPAPAVATLTARTEGWAAGLRLAALALRHAEDPARFVAAFSASHRFLTDYLVDEVLSSQPPHRKAFLLQTAVLDRLSGPLCDAVLGLGDGGPPAEGRDAYSQPVLEELERANLFLTPLDAERRWYRYHQLFAEFLRMRLDEAEPGHAAALRRRAAAWCRASGLPREALGYALAAGDHAATAELIEELAPEALGREGPAAVLGWVEALPAPLRRARPGLCAAYAWALTFGGRAAEAAAALDHAEAALPALEPAARERIAGQIAAHRAYLSFFHGDFGPARAAAERALALLPAADAVLRVRTAVILCTVLRFAGRLDAAEAALAPLAEPARATGDVYAFTLHRSSLGEVLQERGRLRQALAAFEDALAFAAARTGRADTPFTALAHVAIGHLRREWDDLDGALAATGRGVALAREWRQADVLGIGLIELAQAHQDRGELDEAGRALDELREVAAQMGSPWGGAQAATFQARLDLARGDGAAAARWAAAGGLGAGDVPDAERVDDYQTLGELLEAQGEHAAAARLLDALARQLRAAGRVDRLLPALVWLARALDGAGRRDEALAALGEALALGEAGGYVRTFVAGGPPVAALLAARSGAAGGRRRGYADRLLAALGAGDEAPAPVAAAGAGLAEPLSERELAVLRLMAAGLGNRAIGERLYLSVNTVRWYASQIFGKLGVAGRGAAVARGRELGLV
jgi:LuxR family maltose regulon positive regulatory protein